MLPPIRLAMFQYKKVCRPMPVMATVTTTTTPITPMYRQQPAFITHVVCMVVVSLQRYNHGINSQNPY
uniref:Uncharacterized protein n=1 Tax=Romanomermis culicivorax TaxID=13658 RepID=A0A915JHV0_ROMCU